MTFQTLASESFSSNWLINKSLPSSLVCLTSSSQDFDFDFVLPTSTYTLVDAGDIFFHGEIVPSFTEDQNSKASSYPTTPYLCMHSSSPTHKSTTHPKHNTILKRWMNSSKKILKYFRISLTDCSPEKSKDGRPLDFCTKNMSFSVEDSIYEAIVYCKRSFDPHMM